MSGARKRRNPPDEPAAKGQRRKRLGPSQKPKLAGRVPTNKQSQATGKPVGRPRTPERLKEVVLGCIRHGLNQSSACEVAGIAKSVLERWKEEPADEDGMDFRLRMGQARAGTKLAISAALVKKAIGGNERAQFFYLTRRAQEYKGEAPVVATDVARDIREFVGQAFLSQRGDTDPATMDRWNDGEDLIDDDDDMGEVE